MHQRYIYFRCLFQSTHPVRGATLPWLAGYRVFKISIHAPRAGCDISQPCLSGDMPRFQSTHPVRGATLPMFPSDRVWIISIHAPRAGCDRCAGYSSNSLRISIHAPRAGCDMQIYRTFHPRPLISIHAPRAGCDFEAAERTRPLTISIHAPRAGCYHFHIDYNGIARISIHAPRAGCD